MTFFVGLAVKLINSQLNLTQLNSTKWRVIIILGLISPPYEHWQNKYEDCRYMCYCNTCKKITYIFANLTFGKYDISGITDIFDIMCNTMLLDTNWWKDSYILYRCHCWSMVRALDLETKYRFDSLSGTIISLYNP